MACRENLLNGIKSMCADWAGKLGESHTLEIATLAAWVDAATPEGDPKDAPPAANGTTMRITLLG